jgi:glutaredoxin-like YruB-family protein
MAVKVYSTPSCGYCTLAKNYLRERQVRFTDINVAADMRKAEEMARKSGQFGVPVIDYDGTIIVGFDKDRLDRLISSKQ